jgi:hypothetical protein
MKTVSRNDGCDNSHIFFWVQTFDVTIIRGQDLAFVSKGLKPHNAHGKVEKLEIPIECSFSKFVEMRIPFSGF